MAITSKDLEYFTEEEVERFKVVARSSGKLSEDEIDRALIYADDIRGEHFRIEWVLRGELRPERFIGDRPHFEVVPDTEEIPPRDVE